MVDYKTLSKASYWCVVCVAVLVSIFYVYYHYCVAETTHGTNYIGDQLGLDIVSADDLTDSERDKYEERWFMQANYYSNAKEDGIQLQELQMNYFMSYKLESIDYRSSGMQYLGDYQTEVHKATSGDDLVVKDFTYYDTTDGISWSGYLGNTYGSTATKLNRDEKYIIKIDNRAFEIQLTGGFTVHKYLWGIKWLDNPTHFGYDWGDVFASIMTAIKSNSGGYGDYYIHVDLSNYFSIYEYDTSSGKFKADDVTDIIKTYAVVKFHYDEHGARNTSQSIFGVISKDSSFDTHDPVDTTYWQERFVYTLTDNALSYRYSSAYGGYCASLTVDTISSINNNEKSVVNIVIDLDSAWLKMMKYNVIGLDYNAFEGLKINKLTIKGTSDEFRLLSKCLNNTQLQTLERSSTITLNIADDAISTAYAEVIV